MMLRVYKKCLSILLRFPLYKVRLFALKRISKGYIGYNVYVGPNLTITMGYADKTMKITLGDRVSLGPNVTLILSSHPNNSKLRKILSPFPKREIEIGEDSWIGANAVIMPNVKIGKMCVIGAGAVVTKDVPNFSIAVGVPAKIIRKINDNCK